jgi:hypothetical protein
MNIRQTLAQWFYSPGAYGLWLALDDVENWTWDEHTAHYRAPPSNPSTYRDPPAVCTMWIANGRSHFDGYPSKGTPKFLGWYERRWLWSKFRTIRNRQMLYRFTRLEEPK